MNKPQPLAAPETTPDKTVVYREQEGILIERAAEALSLLDQVLEQTVNPKIPLDEVISETGKDKGKSKRGKLALVVTSGQNVQDTSAIVFKAKATRKPSYGLSQESTTMIQNNESQFDSKLGTKEMKEIVRHMINYDRDPEAQKAMANMACRTCGGIGDSSGWHWYAGVYIPCDF